MARVTSGLFGSDGAGLRQVEAAIRRTSGIGLAFASDDPSLARRSTVRYKPDVFVILVTSLTCGGLSFLKELNRNWPLPMVVVNAAKTDHQKIQMIAQNATVLELAEVDALSVALEKAMAPVLQAPPEEGATDARRVSAVPPKSPFPHVMPLNGIEVIGIASSTGGMRSLAQVLEGFPVNLPPVVITQHIRPGYIERSAARLAQHVGHTIGVAQHGETLRRNQIRFAPDGRHLTLKRGSHGPVVEIIDSDPKDAYVPAAENMLDSLAVEFRNAAIGVILTGMGRDGAQAMVKMRKAGAFCIGESEASCTVYGMSRAAMQLGGIDIELHASEIGQYLGALLRKPLSARRAS